jgi:plastocyanin
VIVIVAVLGAGMCASLALATEALAACGNPVACENALPGDPTSDWQVTGVGDSTIQGFATSMSVNVGGTISFKIKTPASAYHIDILRLGYYGGLGARKIASNVLPTATLPQSQPACQTTSSTGLVDCGNWGVSASWTVPSNVVSGVYIAHLVRNDTGGSSQIPFVVRNDASTSNVLLSTSDATWQAYNAYGGNSLYGCTVACPPGNPGGYKGAFAVSYNRPFDGTLASDNGQSYLYYAEYQMLRFLEKNGYDVSYTSSSDVDRDGAQLLNHKVFMSSAHDEYWSAGQRANVEAARDHGVNLAFFSGNEMFWKTRWASDGSGAPYRTLVSYKETHFDAPTDPSDPPTWTGTWRDPRFSPPADADKPENSVTGQFFIVNAGTTDIQVPYQYAKLRLWRNTAVANLASGQTLTLGAGIGTLGYEWDEDANNGFRSAGLIDESGTTSSTAQTFTDYGTTVASNQTATHHLTLYRAPSGALVFGAGTVQWAWGLDNTNAWGEGSTDPSGKAPDPNMQQATINLLADMGAQPNTLASGLGAATPSSDMTAPTSTISSPTAGANLQDGAKTTITGSATDSGGGLVAGVEVSTDGGKTWNPATITTPDGTTVNWSYNTWVAHGSPTTTIESRATDDSANMENPSAGTQVNVSCPCSIWGATLTNPVDSGDAASVEVGMKFTTSTFGTVSGVRFYKVSANTGTHVGSLWSSSGQLLSQATFSGESSSGWQQVSFPSPVPINPNTVYVVSYHAPVGHYAQTDGYFYPHPSEEPDGNDIADSPPLHAVRSTEPSINGLYQYGSTPAFPSGTYQGRTIGSIQSSRRRLRRVQRPMSQRPPATPLPP